MRVRTWTDFRRVCYYHVNTMSARWLSPCVICVVFEVGRRFAYDTDPKSGLMWAGCITTIHSVDAPETNVISEVSAFRQVSGLRCVNPVLF